MKRRALLKHGASALSILAVPFSIAIAAKYSMLKSENIFDVIIVSGSYACLSAAMALELKPNQANCLLQRN